MPAQLKAESVLHSKDALGEVPIWNNDDDKLWWIDVRAPAIQSWHPRTGEHRRFKLPGSSVGSWAFRQGGGMLVSLSDGLYGFDPASGNCERLLALEATMDGHRLNDGRCDTRGRFWIGTMHDTVREPRGAFYRVEAHSAGLSVEKVFDGVDIPNSVVFSPDDRLMYFADTPAKKIWVFDFDVEAGCLSNRRVFVDCANEPGAPDGSAMDADGCLWNAKYGGSRIVRYTPRGAIDCVIDLPVTQPTCCVFGGPDLDTLYITTARQKLTPEQLMPQPLAGNVFALRPGAKGIALPRFAG
jgi:sugar lactone lactonase YvrE